MYNKQGVIVSIVIKDLSKSFDDKIVLNRINMTLEENSIYCLMGASGTGKTTLLRIILGLETPDSGSITGIEKYDCSPVFQEDRLIPWLSAIENVSIVCHGNIDKDSIYSELAAILPEDSLNIPVSSLSGGMKRRVALVRALLYSGSLIVLDEPFTGLDNDTRLNAIEYIQKKRNNRTVLITTHSEEDARLLGGKILWLD